MSGVQLRPILNHEWGIGSGYMIVQDIGHAIVDNPSWQDHIELLESQ